MVADLVVVVSRADGATGRAAHGLFAVWDRPTGRALEHRRSRQQAQSGAIGRNRAQSGAIGRNRAQSGAIGRGSRLSGKSRGAPPAPARRSAQVLCAGAGGAASSAGERLRRHANHPLEWTAGRAVEERGLGRLVPCGGAGSLCSGGAPRPRRHGRAQCRRSWSPRSRSNTGQAAGARGGHRLPRRCRAAAVPLPCRCRAAAVPLPCRCRGALGRRRASNRSETAPAARGGVWGGLGPAAHGPRPAAGGPWAPVQTSNTASPTPLVQHR